MRFISTRGSAPAATFGEALLAGLAPDGGLYVPERLIPFAAHEIDALRGASLIEVGTAIGAPIIGDEIPRDALRDIIADALDFPVPLVPLDDTLAVLELFHGPTFAFKDVGARTMARLMAYYVSRQSHDERPMTVLVATSGDTGSAVAQAFHGVPGIRVVVLFPEGQVTPVQEAQFTTLGGNVAAVAAAGTFDDCQRLVKLAFRDDRLRKDARLTSANSINIGRLLPQVFYYAHASLQRPGARWSVPSGNFGNLTAGVLAWKLGFPIAGFVAATTVNDTFPRYLATGRYQPRASVTTLANAMDVGDPSNVERLRWLFDDRLDAMRQTIAASVHTDDDVRAAIHDVVAEHGYVCDPHTAIAYLGARKVRSGPVVFLSTAHPAKFREVVEPAVGRPVPLPPALEEALQKPRQVERIAPRLTELSAVLQ